MVMDGSDLKKIIPVKKLPKLPRQGAGRKTLRKNGYGGVFQPMVAANAGEYRVIENGHGCLQL
jgi:hypothetical protein